MKVAFLCCVLLLAGCASAGPVEANSISLPDGLLDIPDWILDLVANLPDSIQEIINKLPEIVAAIPDVLDKLKEIVEEIINKIPEIIPVIIDKLPEIVAQIPALVERIVEILRTIIERIPELIPIILEKIPELIEAIPGIVDKLKELFEKIKEILEGLELPDWFPTLPDLEKPEWWPELPTLPEYNPPTPGVSTTVEEYPGIVQIEVGTGPIWAQGCAGSVLNSVYIVSAARCFSGKLYNDRFRRVRAGSSTRFEDGLISSVASVLNHPSFGENTLDGDLSIVRLTNPLTLGATIAQTPIVSQDFVLPDGIGVNVVAWGSTAQGKLISDRGLYEIGLVTVNKDSCQERWNKIPVVSITDNTICVADPLYGGRNGDIRDIGAPVYYGGILVGVVSFGVPVGNQYFPVVTTNVASYTNWVVENAV